MIREGLSEDVAFELRSEGRAEVSTAKKEGTAFHTEGTSVAQGLTSEQAQ